MTLGAGCDVPPLEEEGQPSTPELAVQQAAVVGTLPVLEIDLPDVQIQTPKINADGTYGSDGVPDTSWVAQELLHRKVGQSAGLQG